MTYHIRHTNYFFKEKIYENLLELAVSPWALLCCGRNSTYDITPVILGAVLWPILLPMTAATSVLAFGLACITALVHGVVLIGAGAADCADYSNEALNINRL